MKKLSKGERMWVAFAIMQQQHRSGTSASAILARNITKAWGLEAEMAILEADWKSYERGDSQPGDILKQKHF